MRPAASLLLAAALGACASLPPDGDGTYANPVLDRDFADPAVLAATDGWFYAYATQTSDRGRMQNIQVARSRDLARWEHLGDALPVKPAWGGAKQNFWAPHVLHDPRQQKYFMYYSAEPDGSTGKCLAVATATAPQGPFVDSGGPMVCGEASEHIDPMAFDDPQSGKPLLYWGSGFRALRVQELAADRLRFLPGSAPLYVVYPDELKPYRILIEAPWVTLRDGVYYFFYSGHRCCGPNPRYAVMVARSASAFGPFEDYRPALGPEGVILEENAHWLAPGHTSVLRDREGNDWMLYHAIDPRQPSFEDSVHGRVSRRVLLLDRIVYEEGWPRIAGSGPSAERQRGPALETMTDQ